MSLLTVNGITIMGETYPEYGGDLTNRVVRMSRVKRTTETLGDDP